jgi:hypothetical protein
MDSVERYRRYAFKCLMLAQWKSRDADKAALLQMAESWRQLAERAEARADRDRQDDRHRTSS